MSTPTKTEQRVNPLARFRRKSTTFLTGFDRNLWILACGWFVAALGFAATIPFISIYFHEQYGMSFFATGLVFGAIGIVRSLIQVIGGELSDRFGRQGLLAYSQFGRVIAFVAIALAINYDLGFWPIMIWLLVHAVCGGLFMPAINSMVSDLLPKEKTLDGFAITRSANNLGWAFGPAIGGFLAATSFALLFFIAAAVTLCSALIFLLWLKVPVIASKPEPFRFEDLLEVRKDRRLATHALLTFLLFLVVAQLIAPFSLYAVEIVGLTKSQMGLLFTLNGFLVAGFQVPATLLMRRMRLTTQITIGAFIYMVGYTSIGIFLGFNYFVIAVMIITVGEVFMSPPSITITSRLAPSGKTGRYMGIYGFFMMAGWSLGPMYGTFILDAYKEHTTATWLMISSLAGVAGVGYLIFGSRLPAKVNSPVLEKAT